MGEHLVIDWTRMPVYNTLMSVSAGAGLLSLVYFARALKREAGINLESWAVAFAIPGSILTITGAHMTLTWPLGRYFPYDNIIFGETSFAFGVLLLAAASYVWMRAAIIIASGDAARYLARAAGPISFFVVGMGLSLIAIAVAGLMFRLFAAPAEEPISGTFASYPWVEAIFVSALFGFVGIGSLLFPLALRSFRTGAELTAVQRIVGILWFIGGLGFFLFGALNFFTHIGLIVRTMS